MIRYRQGIDFLLTGSMGRSARLLVFVLVFFNPNNLSYLMNATDTKSSISATERCHKVHQGCQEITRGKR